MSRIRRLLLLLAVLPALLLAPAAALADGDAVIRDCTDDGTLSGSYSQGEYREALAELPTDVDEYTDCRDVIRSAQLGAAGGRGRGAGSAGGGGTAGPGGTPGAPAAPGAPGAPAAPAPTKAEEALAGASPQERAAVDAGRQRGSGPIKVGEQLVEPGALGLGTVGAVNGLPATLVVVLVLLALALGAGGAHLVRTRVVGRRAP